MLPTEPKLTLQLTLGSALPLAGSGCRTQGPAPLFSALLLWGVTPGHLIADTTTKAASVEAELARGHLTTVLCTNGKWKKLYFAFFINSELSLACTFPQVKRTSGVRGIVV